METDIDEIKALFGLLYLAGVLKAQHINLEELWSSEGVGPEIFRNVISQKRFYFLLRALRFDNVNTRIERRKLDKLAPIREVFDSFVQQCISHYEVGPYTTIDEMLEAFRGKCNFRQYIPSKPAKYGIKIYSLVDAEKWYTSNMEIYLGKQPEGPFYKDNSSAAVVKRLVGPIIGTWRNVTCDNFFTSVPLAVELVKRKKLTMVGTLRKNKREIPPLFINAKERPQHSTIFGYGSECLLASYVPKKNKNVLMLSTMHKDGIIDAMSGEDCKPEVITFYNKTKSGVDVVDNLKSLYSVARISCRWPLTIFFTLLNLSGINSHLIYFENVGDQMSRRNFLKNLAIELARPHQMKRANMMTLPTLLRMQIRSQLKLPEVEMCRTESTSSREKCAFCPKKKNRKTMVRCSKPECKLPICGEHTKSVCVNCWEKEEPSE